MSGNRAERDGRNVTEVDFGTYLTVFAEHIITLAERYLPGLANQLAHTNHLPGRITGYVSTQYGVAYEIERTDTTTVTTRRGSARVEDLVWSDAPAFVRAQAAVRLRNSSWLTIQGLSFKDQLPVRLEGDSHAITLVNVRCFSDSFTKVTEFLFLSARRAADLWTPDAARARAAEEVLRASAELQLATKLSTSIEAFVREQKERTVLVLGSYEPSGRKRLEHICAALKAAGYEPFLVDDVRDYPAQTLQQKVTMLGGIARFVVFDDTDLSGHVLEAKLAMDARWITVLLQGRGHSTTWMLAELAFGETCKAFPYDVDNAGPAIRGGVEWAEATWKRVADRNDRTYPWRAGFGAAHEPTDQ